MLEQGWPLDSSMDEKSKATIEKMLLEEQYYINGKSSSQRSKRLPVPMSLPSKLREDQQRAAKDQKKSSWTDEEKRLFHQGMEIYGRSWTKISELIPTRTSIQIKNFAHQFFKSQKYENSQIPGSTTGSISDTTTEEPPKDPLTETLVKVTTASPTVGDSVLFRKDRMTKGQRDLSKPTTTRNFLVKEKSTSPPKQNKHEVAKFGSQRHRKLIQKNEKKSGLCSDKAGKHTHSIEGLNLISSNRSSSISPGLLDRKMTITPGLIENLDRFCAVADIIERGKEEIEEDDIDIENDDENDLNLILQSRSTSPNSVYEKLIAEANLNNEEDVSQPEGNSNAVNLNISGENVSRDSSVVHCNDGIMSDIDKVPVTEETKGTGKSETAVDQSTSMTQSKVVEKIGSPKHVNSDDGKVNMKREDPPKAYVNALITCEGNVVHFPIPTLEKVVDLSVISDEEKCVHKDFFERKSMTKTPERYLKIRNYLLDAWKKVKPNYLNKTSVRSGLKNCGDVNCIGRIHAYLECTGAINFNCEEAAYRHLRSVFQQYQKDRTKDSQMEVNLAKLEAMRPRKRKVKDAFGVWIDEKELEGKTIEHADGSKVTDSKQSRPVVSRNFYDPFKLVPCLSFSDTISAPFQVEIHNSCLIVMDIHSHISKTEVIGMLGGRFCEEQGKLTIVTANPCSSISTGLQCEMDPVSQTQASEEIRGSGLEVVGWYHSHPTFAPNPSVRDIETQLKFQDWFSKGGSNFVGVIVSPYNPRNHQLCSEVNCLTISSEVSTILKCNIPYKFVYTTKPIGVNEINTIILTAQDLATSYTTNPHRVDLTSTYSVSRGLTCLEKMLESVKVYFSGQENEDCLNNIRKVFTMQDVEERDKCKEELPLMTDSTLYYDST